MNAPTHSTYRNCSLEALIAWAQEHGVTVLETAIGALAAAAGLLLGDRGGDDP